MGATVQEATKKIYTDSSGKFYEGMTKKEAEGKYSLFYLMNQEKEFNRIDKDKNGELSKSEITSEIESDIKAYRKGTKWMCGLGIFSALSGMITQKTASTRSKVISLGVTLWCLGAAVADKLLADNLEQRIVQGCN